MGPRRGIEGSAPGNQLEPDDNPIELIFCVTAETDLSSCAAMAFALMPFSARDLSVANSLAVQEVADEIMLRVDEETAETPDMESSFLE